VRAAVDQIRCTWEGLSGIGRKLQFKFSAAAVVCAFPFLLGVAIDPAPIACLRLLIGVEDAVVSVEQLGGRRRAGPRGRGGCGVRLAGW
jgi:hypothetical protein